jgi:assimilatory nitrate reductase electron transfer subunit
VSASSTSAPTTLVIGHGLAAARLIQLLVARGVTGVSVVGDEPQPAYNRLLLSAVLAGGAGEEDLLLRSPQWYDRHGVTVLGGTRATGLDPRSRTVTLQDGRQLTYGRLVLATGSRPNLPTLRGLTSVHGGLLPGVHAFRTLQDCHGITESAKEGMHAVVIGGGLLGVEAARGLSLRGLSVEIVHQGPHLMERQLDPGAGAVLLRSLERHGITTYTDSRAVAVLSGPKGGVRGVRLADHFELACDLAVFACGIRPATALAQAGGLRTVQGIVVDDSLATSSPDVWAIGECAEHRGVVHGWAQAAVDQADVLADVLTGGPATYRGSQQVTRLRAAGVPLAAMGETHATADDSTEVMCLADPVRGTYRKTVIRNGRLVGALLVGDTSAIGGLTRAFDRGTPLPPDRRDLLFTPPLQGRVA